MNALSAMDWIAILAGAAAVAWVNWYFFWARGGAVSARSGEGGIQEVVITVHGGYAPAEVRLRRGVPARLVFDRQETSSCSEEVVLPDFGIRKYLPAFERTVVELRPDAAGTFDFTCGMSMLHGKLVVDG